MSLGTFLVLFGSVALFFAAGISIRLLLRSENRLEVKPATVSVVRYRSIPVGLCLRRRNWRYGPWYDLPATFLVQPVHGGIFTVDPVSAGSNEIQPVSVFAVTGIAPGVDGLVVSMTAEGETQAYVVELPISVAPELNGELRRIRHTPKALVAATFQPPRFR